MLYNIKKQNQVDIALLEEFQFIVLIIVLIIYSHYTGCGLIGK